MGKQIPVFNFVFVFLLKTVLFLWKVELPSSYNDAGNVFEGQETDCFISAVG